MKEMNAETLLVIEEATRCPDCKCREVVTDFQLPNGDVLRLKGMECTTCDIHRAMMDNAAGEQEIPKA